MLSWQTELSSERELKEHFNFLFSNRKKLIPFIFDLRRPVLRRSSKQLLQEMKVFSHSEQLLIRIALDLFDGSGKALLLEVFQILDQDTLLKLMKILKIHSI